MKDSLGDRIKGNYENRTRVLLPRRTNTIIRIDGKAFHTYTRNLKKPFDSDLMDDLNATLLKLCSEVQGCKLGYVQSDEMSLWLTDYDSIDTSTWFDGNIQKITSVSASIATAEFNHQRVERCLLEARDLGCLSNDIDDWAHFTRAYFDARVFIIPELHEVANYFLWRSQDAARNSVQMLSRSLYSHSECEGKNNSQLQDMIFAKGQNWNNLPSNYKCGRIAVKKPYQYEYAEGSGTMVQRSNWEIQDCSYSYDYWFDLVTKYRPLNIAHDIPRVLNQKQSSG